MSFVRSGGRLWTPQLVGWGSPGRQKDQSLIGYHAKKNGRGRMSAAERKRLTVDVWKVQAVYALFNEGRLLYVGEGTLGDRLLQHWRDDELAGRWDSFTWLSPFAYERPGDAADTAKVGESSTAAVTMAPKTAVELLELAAIHLGNPTENSQLPESAKTIVWLDQVRAESAPESVEEILDEVRETLARLEAAIGTKRG